MTRLLSRNALAGTNDLQLWKWDHQCTRDINKHLKDEKQIAKTQMSPGGIPMRSKPEYVTEP